MKKRQNNSDGELRAEYDLGQLLPKGVRGKYAANYAAGSNLVLIDPEIHKSFKTAKEINEALRLVLELRKIGTRRKPLSR